MDNLKAALLYLSSEDPDRAGTRNDRGFNGRDTGFGNSLAEQLQAGRRLSANQYAAARKMLQTYRVQVQKGTGIDVTTLPEEMPTVASRSGSVPSLKPGKCSACGDPINVGDLIDLVKLGNAWTRSHAGGLCPSRTAAPISPMGEVSDEELPWRSRPARTYEEIFDGPRPTRVELSPIVTGTGFTVDGILGPGGSIAQQLPGYEHRETQLEGARACERAMAEGGHLVCEAGTGTGKSLMYLTAAINSGRRTLVSTADKALQGQIWLKDIPFLQKVYAGIGRQVRAALLKGRSNYACLHKVSELRGQLLPTFKSFEAGQSWAPFLQWLDAPERTDDCADLEMFPGEMPGELRSEVTSDSDSCLGKRCPLYTSCHVENAKARAEGSDIVVVNHALLMRHLSIKAASGGYVTVVPDGDQIVLDEAHHLEDVATDAFGVQITAARWNRLYARLERLTVKHREAIAERAANWIERADLVSGPLDTLLQTIQARMEKSKDSAQRLGDEAALITPALAPLAALAGDMRSGTPSWLDGEDADRDAWEKLAKQTRKMAEDLAACNAADLDNEYVRYAELEMLNGRIRIVLNVKPIDVAEALREMLFSAIRTVVSTSATIATGGSMSYWRERVGCDEATELEVGSPFDYKRNGVLYLPERSLALKLDSSAARGANGMEAYTDTLATEIERLILASRGGVFALFTSYRMLNAVYERLSPRLQDYLVLRQGEAPRGRLVERFKAAKGRAVLFGTKSFSEGVDIQGEALSLVIIDKFAFVPPSDPIFDARKDKITRETGDDWAWFNRLAIPNATIAIKQAVGRLIRTTTDRGTVAILDGRAITKPYGKRITNSLPPFTQTQSLEVVRAFFS